MTFEPDNTFGTIDIYCDGKNCSSYEQHEGFDGHCDFSGAVQHIKEYGWITRKIDGEWCHFCSQECYENY